MPPVGSTLLDTNAIALIGNWITNGLANYLSFADWQLSKFGSTNAPNAAANADPDHDGAINYLEYLTGTDPLDPSTAWRISASFKTNHAAVSFLQVSNRAFQVQFNGLLSSNSWAPLDVAGNEPIFSITNKAAAVIDLQTNSAQKFYRVKIIEP